MKISLIVAAAATLAILTGMTGCGTSSAPRAASSPAGTTTITSAPAFAAGAAFAPTSQSSLAPAAWDDDGWSDGAPAAPAQTWGAADEEPKTAAR